MDQDNHESRVKVTLAATDDLTGVAYKERRDAIQRSLEQAVDRIRTTIPDLHIDWATVSTPAQLVVGDARGDEIGALIHAAGDVGVLVDPLLDQDVRL